jgi:hypothetical protein
VRGPRTSIVLLVLGLACLFAGTAMLYLREEIFDSQSIADKAVAALDDSDVRQFVARRTTHQLINKVDPNLVSVRPLLEVGIEGITGSGAFKSALHQGVESAYSTTIDGNDDAVVTAANLGVLVSQGLQQLKPQLAKQIPKGFDSALVRLGKGGFATDLGQLVEKLRLLGLILPVLGLLLVGGGLAIAPDRRRAATLMGAGLAIAGVIGVTALVVVHGVLGLGIDGDTDRAAFNAVWGVFVTPLRNWYLVVAGAGIVIASAAASALRPREHGALLRGIWRRIATEPESTRARLVWAAALTVLALLMIFDPLFVLQVLMVIGGAYLLSRATSTVIALAGEPVSAAQSRRERRRIAIWSVAGIAVAVLVALALIAIIGGGRAREDKPAAANRAGCNGSKALCGRSLDKVSVAATHNSYAGANYPGFLFPEQNNRIPEQLDAGVRGLWIDTYYGVPGRRVYTDTSKVDPALIAQLDQELGPKFTAAGNRIRAQIAKPPPDAKTKIYLCHGFCELGAVDAGETFREIADFMKANPREVLIIDLEDYTTPKDTQALIKRTGLVDYIYKGPQGPPWPTLQEMINSGGRILLIAEHMTGGASWYRPLNKTIQETPFDFRKPSDMTCRGGRGNRADALFLINNWINTDPTPKPTNAAKVNARKFLVDRAQKCQRQRDAFPNILNVDFYKDGDLFGAVDELNGVSAKSK